MNNGEGNINLWQTKTQKHSESKSPKRAAVASLAWKVWFPCLITTTTASRVSLLGARPPRFGARMGLSVATNGATLRCGCASTEAQTGGGSRLRCTSRLFAGASWSIRTTNTWNTGRGQTPLSCRPTRRCWVGECVTPSFPDS